MAQVDREALVAQLAIPFPAVATLLFDSNRQLPAMVRQLPALVTSFIHPVSLAPLTLALSLLTLTLASNHSHSQAHCYTHTRTLTAHSR